MRGVSPVTVVCADYIWISKLCLLRWRVQRKRELTRTDAYHRDAYALSHVGPRPGTLWRVAASRDRSGPASHAQRVQGFRRLSSCRHAYCVEKTTLAAMFTSLVTVRRTLASASTRRSFATAGPRAHSHSWRRPLFWGACFTFPAAYALKQSISLDAEAPVDEVGTSYNFAKGH